MIHGAMIPPALVGNYFSTGEPIWTQSSSRLVNEAAPVAIVPMTVTLVMLGAMLLGWSTSTRALSVTLTVTVAFMGLFGLLYLVAPEPMIENSRRGPHSPTGARVLGGVLMAVAVVGASVATYWVLRTPRSRR